MQHLNFEDVLEKIVEQDSRFHRDAYLFVREGLDFVQKTITKMNRNQPRHVTGQELLAGLKEYALTQFGPMAYTVLTEWGVSTTQDFGLIVFNMVEAGLLSKTEDDSLDDFKNGYNFQEVFQKPFLPSRKLAALCPPAREASPLPENQN
ncbi:MAG TPA: Minf_1886 family protein [Methylomirabilota bacterium]|nr:Minf_1886 family protein [Methylomirabilota bacterium]